MSHSRHGTINKIMYSSTESQLTIETLRIVGNLYRSLRDAQLTLLEPNRSKITDNVDTFL